MADVPRRTMVRYTNQRHLHGILPSRKAHATAGRSGRAPRTLGLSVMCATLMASLLSGGTASAAVSYQLTPAATHFVWQDLWIESGCSSSSPWDQFTDPSKPAPTKAILMTQSALGTKPEFKRLKITITAVSPRNGIYFYVKWMSATCEPLSGNVLFDAGAVGESGAAPWPAGTRWGLVTHCCTGSVTFSAQKIV